MWELEPVEPLSLTSTVPGPQSMLYKETMTSVSNDALTVKFHIDNEKCIGNYISDADGNLYLDMFMNIAAVPIGYNHPRMMDAIQSGVFNKAIAFRQAIAVHPPKDFHYTMELIKKHLAYHPDQNYFFNSCGCGQWANENAAKAAFYWKHRMLTGREYYTQEELDSCMCNEAPGRSDYKMVSMVSAFHGRGMGMLSLTNTNKLHKVMVPSFQGWPKLEFPDIKYPLEEHAEANRREEDRCLSLADDLFRNDGTIAAFIIEPIMAEGGDKQASNEFYNRLRNLCTQYQVAFICDEVQTGLSTGRTWAHSYWNLDSPPDFITYAKKCQAAGFVAKDEFRPKFPYQIFNTWAGDYLRTMQFEIILDEIEKENLHADALHFETRVKEGLNTLQQTYGNISNVRGKGVTMAFDIVDDAKRPEFIAKQIEKGIIQGLAGTNSIRIRPCLAITDKHIDLFLDRTENTLKDL